MPMQGEMRRVGAYDEKEASREAAIVFNDRSRTQQSQAAGTDINKIVKDFKVTGFMPQGVRVPKYGDFEGIEDFRGAMDAILQAQKSFAAMSAEVRKKFQNDPQLFLEFCADPANLDEMRKMGLAVPAKEKPKPVEVIVTNPADSGPPK